MAEKKETAVVQGRASRDPLVLLREITSELGSAFERPFGTAFGRPSLRRFTFPDSSAWVPEIDVFERDNRLVTKVDLPGLKKEDVKVEVAGGRLAISGERKRETEEKKNSVYRCERSYGSFYRAVPLPEGAKLEDVKATFSDGVLEVSVPLPAKVTQKPRTVQIEDVAKPAKGAAA